MGFSTASLYFQREMRNIVRYRSYNGEQFIEVDGSLTLNDLAGSFVKEWVPYVDCGKCGRSEYCKYSEVLPGNQTIYREIKCGVVVYFLEQVCELANDNYIGSSADEKDSFLESLYHLSKFCFDSEHFIGLFQKSGFASNLYDGQLGSTLLGSVIYMREQISEACANLQKVPFASSGVIMVLVEGQSEKEFLDTLKIYSSAYLGRIVVESYDGKDNRTKNKIFLLVNYFKKKGYKVIIQVDKDGNPGLNSKNHYGLAEHVRSGLIQESDIFAFNDDLEASYPTDILVKCLAEFGLDEHSLLLALDKPVPGGSTLYKHLENELEWMPPKPLLAKAMALFIENSDALHDRNNDELDIVKFFKFVSGHAMKI